MKGSTNRVLGRKSISVAGAVVAAGLAFAMPRNAHATVIFDDTFGSGSQLNPATYPTPSGNSTGYVVLSSKAATASTLSAGSLNISQVSSTSAITEVQAKFANTPVALNVGDTLTLTMTFVDNNGVLTTGSNTTADLAFGLASSNGSANTPNFVTGLNSGGLSGGSTTAGSPPAGVSSYVGYSAEDFFTLNATGARVRIRPAQTQNNNSAQDLILDGASSGNTYTGGASLTPSTNASQASTLVAGNTYTEVLSVLSTGATSETFTSTLYNGVGTGGLTVNNYTAATTGTTFETSAFDTLAFGWVGKVATSPNPTGLNVSEIRVDLVQVPEPATLGIVGMGCLALLKRRHRKA